MPGVRQRAGKKISLKKKDDEEYKEDKARSAQWRADNPEQFLQQMKDWYEKNKNTLVKNTEKKIKI